MSLRIVLMGTGEFALPPFLALMECPKHDVVGVYTQPDRTGRGHHRHVNQVKVLAQQHSIPVYQPESVNEPEALQQLRSLSADVFIVAAYGQIMRREFLEIPRLGAFNLHGSVLPRHRGAAPVQYSIWKGDKLAGVTIFQIERGLDSGPMVGHVTTEIDNKETSGELMLRLADLSVGLTLNVVDQLEAGTAVFESQNKSQVTLAPKIRKEDGVIDWSETAEQISCHVRAMQPWPKATTWLHSEGKKPLRCILLDVDALPGAESSEKAVGSIELLDRKMRVRTADGWIIVNTIQPDGKKPMDALAFVNGYGVTSPSRFSTDSGS